MLALLDYQGLLAHIQGLSQGSALLGKEISFTNTEGSEQQGTVSSIYVAEDGEVRLRLDAGDEVALRQVTSIGMPAEQAGN